MRAWIRNKIRIFVTQLATSPDNILFFYGFCKGITNSAKALTCLSLICMWLDFQWGFHVCIAFLSLCLWHISEWACEIIDKEGYLE